MTENSKHGHGKLLGARPDGMATPAASPAAGAGVALAQGGGALRGMGERIHADACTGAASLSIPVHVTAARSFTPALSLDYSSNGGQGIFGSCFALTLSSITRRTSHGVPRYDDSDVFMLDGEVLVPDAAGAAIRTVGTASYNVLRFRPRLEDHARRIERWLPRGRGGVPFWRVLGHDGTIRYFGMAQDCRISDPQDATRIYAWLEELALDAKGEAASYAYKQEDAANVAVAPYEQGRVRTAQRYPKRICYGNRTPVAASAGVIPDLAGVEWHYEIVFDYGEYDFTTANRQPYAPVRAWSARPDPFSAYVSGFERRTHRLCRNIAVFHRFEDAWGSEPVLVCTTALRYDENPAGSLLAGVQDTGWRYRPGQDYRCKSMPGLTFAYVPFVPGSGSFRPLRGATGEPLGGASPASLLADLNGEGVPGVLYRDGATTQYWEPVQAELEQGAMVAYERGPLRAFPNAPGALSDLDGNSRLELLAGEGGLAGYFESTPAPDTGWMGMVPLRSVALDGMGGLAEPVDLSGSGFADLVLVRQGALWYSESRGTRGFLPAVELPLAEGLPLSAMPAPHELVGFADLLGAGTPQRYRIRNGNVELWPSLGYGVFGARIVLDGAPLFGPDWDPARLMFADLDGSGCASLVYVHGDRADIYANRSGNSFAPVPLVLGLPATVAQPGQVSFANLSGSGECMLVRQELPSAFLWACDFCSAGKPYLLAEVADPLGTRTSFRYASSSSFCLEDKAAGRPWVTSLPFPLQVVAQVEAVDLVSGTRQVTTYAYHHGYYDTFEREFRGFGMVEQTDVALPAGAERAAALAAAIEQADGMRIAAPTLLREWFELGAWELEAALQAARAREFFVLDAQAFSQLQVQYAFGTGGAKPEAVRQAQVAAAGTKIRSELYALDPGSALQVPFSVQQWGATVTMLQVPEPESQPASRDPSFMRYGVYFRHEREAVDSEYDRVADDPHIRHHLALALDDYGNVTRACTISYPRRPCLARIPEQVVQYALAETTGYLQLDLPDVYLVGLACDERSYQLDLDKLLPDRAAPSYYAFDALADALTSALAGPLAYFGAAPVAGAAAMVLSWHRAYFQGEGGGEAPPHVPAPQALLVRSETAAFADAAVAALFDGVPVPGGLAALLSEQGGYRLEQKSGLWWAPGDTVVHGTADQFFQPLERRDAFAARKHGRSGTITSLGYDPDWLLVMRAQRSGRDGDVLGHEATVDAIDYAGPEARRITVNGLTTEAAIDPLGRVVAVSYHGSEWTGQGPVRAGFTAIGETDWYDWPEPADMAALADDPATFIRGAAQYFYTDEHAFAAGRGPVGTANLHAASYPDPADSGKPGGDVRMAVSYQDGMGREAQTMILAEPGQAILCGSDGAPCLPLAYGEAAVRWRCSGRKRRNGNGQVFEIRKPYFSDSYLFSPDSAVFDMVGEPETFTHDALGRLSRASRPLGSLRDALFSRKEYGPWAEAEFDENDTIKQSLYYQMVESGVLVPPPLAKAALEKSAAFDDTPSTRVYDTLEHPVRELARLAPGDVAPLSTQRGFAPMGFLMSVADPRLSRTGLANSRLNCDISGHVLKDINADAGTLYTLPDVNGAVCFSYDGRGTSVLPSFDSLHRVTQLAVWPGAGARHCGTAAGPLLVERTIYGDSLDGQGKPPVDHVLERNLMDHTYVAYGDAGSDRTPVCSLLGMPLASQVRVRAKYGDTADWSSASTDWAALFADLDRQMLQDDLAGTGSPELATGYEYNALEQLLKLTDPGGNVQRFSYYIGGLPAGSWFAARGETERPVTAELTYDVYGEQTGAACVNGEGTRFLSVSRSYDPDTQNLTRIVSVRRSDGQLIQDLVYWYDPVGNVSHIENKCAQALPLVLPAGVTRDQDYTYDALYRLTTASGLALQNLTLADTLTGRFDPFIPSGRAANYTLQSKFDDGGNLTTSVFAAGANTWTETLTVSPLSNRAARIPGDQPPISAEGYFDANGNQLKMPGGGTIDWNWRNQISALIAGTAQPVTEHYVYAGPLQRRRKVTDGWTPDGAALVEHQFEIGSFQVRCIEAGGGLAVVLRTTRIEHGEHMAFERLDWASGHSVPGIPNPEERYQLTNMQGSSVLEVDGTGTLVTYEEYAASGATVFALGRSVAEASLKRYRYSGQERDQASGLYYYGARYLEPFPGRWMSPDPAGDIDGPNRYAFLGGNPASHVDFGGLAKRTKKSSRSRVAAHIKAKAVPPHKFKRPGFTTRANKMKRKGTDLAHRTSWEKLQDTTQRYRQRTLGQRSFKEVMKSIAPSLAQTIDNFASQPITHTGAAHFLKQMNSAEENLRPGDRGRNRSIKGRFDSGVQDSTSRQRARSPSPISKRQLVSQLKNGEGVKFFTRGTVIESSQHKGGIQLTDMQSSLGDVIGRVPTMTRVGNEVRFKL
jgi:insecticidal toxin complex protein TccC